MANRKRNLQFVPRLESLEHRLVPVGGVFAWVSGGSLNVVGDSAGNAITLVGNGKNAVTISSIDGTTVNGHTAALTLSGVTDGVFIKLGNGTNNIEINNVSSDRDFWVAAGTGNNTIGLANVTSGKSISIATTGFGNDAVYLNACAAKTLFINAGAGTDNVSVSNSRFGANSSISDVGTASNIAIVNDRFGANFRMSGFTLGQQNLTPIAAADTATVANGGSVVVKVLANDRAVTPGLLPGSVTVSTGPRHGTATANSDGTITYKHDGMANTSDSFAYVIADILGNVSNVSTVAITIGTTTTGPVAGSATAAVTEGQAVTIDLGKVTTVSNGTLNLASLAITKQPATGTIVINADGTVKYTQNGNFATSDTFQYTFADSTGAVSNAGTATVTITPTDHPPVAVNDTATLNPSASATINLAANDTDADGTSDIDLTSIKIVTQPAHGTIVVNADGTVSYKHDGSPTSSDSFTYTISDKEKAVSNAATVAITINQLTVAITTTEPNPTAEAAIPFTATFSEGVTGFTAANVIANGTIANFVAVNPTTYTFTVAPTADGLVTASINAGVATGTTSGLKNVAAAGSANSVRTAIIKTLPNINSSSFVASGTQGLKIWDVQTGTGTAVTASTTSVTNFYIGMLASNGSIFDQSTLTSGTAATFTLSSLIQGYQQGVQGMKPGGIRYIFIPSALGYGSSPRTGIPANSDLVFEVKLVSSS